MTAVHADEPPRWRGINHLALITTDMDATTRFYHGVLGARLVATIGTPDFRHYFFEFGPEQTVAFFEYRGVELDTFAKPAGLAFLAATGWGRAAERSTIAPATDGRPVAELVRGDVLIVAPTASVRDVVVSMTEQHVSYALIRLRDGGLGIFTDRDLRTRVVAAGLPGFSTGVPVRRGGGGWFRTSQ